MSVIPFNPDSGRGGQAAGSRMTVEAPSGAGATPGQAGGQAPAGHDGPAAAVRHGEIHLLESALIAALRENATNWARAERAEEAENAGPRPNGSPRRKGEGDESG